MAKGLIRCDKCFNIFDPKEARGIFGSVNDLRIVDRDTYDSPASNSITITAASITVGTDKKPFDLCPDCMAKLLAFLKPGSD